MSGMVEYSLFANSTTFRFLCVGVGVMLLSLFFLLRGRGRRHTGLTFFIYLVWLSIYAGMLSSSGL